MFAADQTVVGNNQHSPAIIFYRIEETTDVAISLSVNFLNGCLITFFVVAPFILMFCIMSEQMTTGVHIMQMGENYIGTTIVHKVAQHICLPLAIVVP